MYFQVLRPGIMASKVQLFHLKVDTQNCANTYIQNLHSKSAKSLIYPLTIAAVYKVQYYVLPLGVELSSPPSPIRLSLLVSLCSLQKETYFYLQDCQPNNASCEHEHSCKYGR